MSRWLFDLGNTRLKLAPLHADGSLGAVHAITHGQVGLEQALAPLLPARAQSACVASVSSADRTLALLQALGSRFASISLARSTASCAGVRNGYLEPGQLGVDRFLALLAARQLGAGPWLVAGVGTALTVDLLDAHGRHRGGMIAPSPASMRMGLHQAATHLPLAGGQATGFADNTLDALASGCEWAALGQLQRSHARASQLLGSEPGLLLHGGGAGGLAASLPLARLVPDLVLLGLARWARLGSSDPSL